MEKLRHRAENDLFKATADSRLGSQELVFFSHHTRQTFSERTQKLLRKVAGGEMETQEAG